jgi:hypothetical protein
VFLFRKEKCSQNSSGTKHVVVKWIIRGNKRTNRIPAAPRLAGSPLPGLAIFFLLQFGHVVGRMPARHVASTQVSSEFVPAIVIGS